MRAFCAPRQVCSCAAASPNTGWCRAGAAVCGAARQRQCAQNVRRHQDARQQEAGAAANREAALVADARCSSSSRGRYAPSSPARRHADHVTRAGARRYWQTGWRSTGAAAGAAQHISSLTCQPACGFGERRARRHAARRLSPQCWEWARRDLPAGCPPVAVAAVGAAELAAEIQTTTRSRACTAMATQLRAARLQAPPVRRVAHAGGARSRPAPAAPPRSAGFSCAAVLRASSARCGAASTSHAEGLASLRQARACCRVPPLRPRAQALRR